MDQKRRMERKKKTLNTERCENIATQYINRIVIIINHGRRYEFSQSFNR